MGRILDSELKNRIITTLFILLFYRFGTFVPIPGINSNVLERFFAGDGSKVFGMINLFSGGALERMSIFALNIMPYITSSIIMQLLTSMYSSLGDLKKDGEYGRSKINQYTRYLTVVLAFFQSVGVYYALSSPSSSIFMSDSKMFMLTTCVSLVGGTVILMWLGERIAKVGVGNGISLIIFVGIISSLPSTVIQVFDLARNSPSENSWILVPVFIFVFFAFLILVCFVEKSYRGIKIQYPNGSVMKSKGIQDSSFLPIKINISGAIPPIFASSILTLPTAIMQLIGSESGYWISILQRGSFLYVTLFSCLIIFFSYFYSSIVFNTEEVASNLKKSNCFIIGVRPGVSTSKYLDKVVLRLTFFGSLYLVFICSIPEILVNKYSIPLYIGGTGILIMVSVVLDLVNQIQSYLITNRYRGGVKKRRVVIR